MKTLYRLTPQGRQRAKWRMLAGMFQAFLVLSAIFFAATVYFWELTLWPSVAVAGCLAVMLALFAVRTWLNDAIAWKDWGLYLDDEQVYLTEFPDSPRIRRAEVTRVTETAAGLIVVGQGRQLYVPEGVEDYDTVKRRLLSWAPRA